MVPIIKRPFPRRTQRLKLSYSRLNIKTKSKTQRGIVRTMRLTTITEPYPKDRYLKSCATLVARPLKTATRKDFLSASDSSFLFPVLSRHGTPVSGPQRDQLLPADGR